MLQLNEKHILLVHPLGYQSAAAERDISRRANIMPPLGLASMAAYLNAAGFVCRILDCYAHPDADRRLRVPKFRLTAVRETSHHLLTMQRHQKHGCRSVLQLRGLRKGFTNRNISPARSA